MTTLQRPDVVTFWHGRRLGYLRQVCLGSQIKLGHRVTIFTFDGLDDAPPGVHIEDAEPILSMAFAKKIRPQRGDRMSRRTIVQFSDFFRMRLQHLGRGVWLDSDVYLLRPIELEPERPYFAWESRKHIGNSVLYLPAAHPIVGAFEELIAQDVLFSDALLFYHRLIGYWRRMRDRKHFVPGNIRLGLYGPAALTSLARRHQAIHDVAECKSFYAMHRRPELFFMPTDYQSVLADPGIVGLHLSPKAYEHDRPAPGSLYEWAARNVREVIGESEPHSAGRDAP